jgi:ribosomal-protein-alanine N-acetyltransferase
LDAPILMTERLAFRPFRPEDFGDFTALHTDPEVQRFIGGVWDEPALREFFDKFLREQPRVGFTKWRVDERDDIGGDGFVGSAGLSLNVETGAADLGYTFTRAAWGRGYAREAARALTDWLFANTDVRVMTACAAVDHAVSRRVLESLGMSADGEREHRGLLCAFYRLERA